MPRTRWRLYGGAAAMLALVAVGAAVATRSSGPAAETAKSGNVLSVTTATAETGSLAETLLVTGSLVAWDDLAIGTEANGLTIREILVEEGDHVTRGQLLARLSDQVLQAQLLENAASVERARAAIGQQDAAIAEAAATLKGAELDFKRAGELIKSASITRQTADQRETAMLTAQARLAASHQLKHVAEADLAVAEATRAEIQAKLAQTEIRAPTDGIVSKRLGRLGMVVPSTTGPGELFHIVRDGVIELDAELPDLALARIQPGQAVSFAPLPGMAPVSGTVRAVAPLVDAQSRMGIVHIRLQSNGALKPGMFMQGELQLQLVEALTVPEAAVLIKDGQPIVFALREADRVVINPVDTGLRVRGRVEIRHGLKAGDRIVVAGAGYLKDGDQVRVVEAPVGRG